MIALLIVAHGNLGESLIQCATFVLGSARKRWKTWI
jgi:mannose/fructose-specific phosphotransferase system component IIA